MKTEFLKAVLGHGAALTDQLMKSELGPYVLTKCVVTWVQGLEQYEDFLPGTDIVLVLNKSAEDTYSGAVGRPDSIHSFEGVKFDSVCAAVLAKLEATPTTVELTPMVKNLGMTLEKLVKATQGGAASPQTGTVAKPKAPQKPQAPEKGPDVAPQRNATPKTKFKIPKLAKPKPAPKTMQLSEMAAKSKCKDCGLPHIAGDKLKGCICARDILKSATITSSDGVWTISGDFADDEFETLKDALDGR